MSFAVSETRQIPRPDRIKMFGVKGGDRGQDSGASNSREL